MHDDAMAGRRAEKLSALLRATDPPAPALAFPAERIARARRQRAVVRWRLAAGIAALLAVAGLVRPVRAWFVETARTFFTRAQPAAVPPVPAPLAAAADTGRVANAVTFAPRAGFFVVELAARQSAGTLRLQRTDDLTASATLSGDPADAEFLVRPGGLRISNRGAATADYTVIVPETVTRLAVRIGREPARDVVLPPGGGAEIPVGAPAARD